MIYNPQTKFLDNIDLQLEAIAEGLEAEKTDKKPGSCFLSDEQITSHYENHYKGYVDGYKEAKRTLKSISKSDSREYRGILLSLSHNYNGIVLHENYFESLGKSELSNAAKTVIDDSFGGFENLKESLVGSLMASRGWVLMGHNKVDDSLGLTIVDQHDIHGMFWTPILALDVWEHAYHIDFKCDKEKYVEALVEDINWDAVSKNIDRIK